MEFPIVRSLRSELRNTFIYLIVVSSLVGCILYAASAQFRRWQLFLIVRYLCYLLVPYQHADFELTRDESDLEVLRNLTNILCRSFEFKLNIILLLSVS